MTSDRPSKPKSTMADNQLNEFKKIIKDKSNNKKVNNLLLTACKTGYIESVKYLLSKETVQKIKYKNKEYFKPEYADEYNHNIFYYCIRNSNVDILDFIINNWPDNYLNLKPTNLDSLLSQSYNEILLYNIKIDDDMKSYINKKLLDLRFHSVPSNSNYNIDFITNRINKLINNINNIDINNDLLEIIYFLKCIAKDIYVLKRLLKCSYISIPWEEMEFYVEMFLFYFKDPYKIRSIFGFNIINLNRMKFHLTNFVKQVQSFKDENSITNVKQLKMLPLMKRSDVVKIIVDSEASLQELYNDFHKLRDIYSLNSVKDAIKLSNSVDANTVEGRLIIFRCLQIMGENLKNTLESPKLSSSTIERIMLCLPSKTKQIIIRLRNDLSHSISLDKRLELLKNIDLFKDLQIDLKNIQLVVYDFLITKKRNLIHGILKDISEVESTQHFQDIILFMDPIGKDKSFPCSKNNSFLEFEMDGYDLENCSEYLNMKKESSFGENASELVKELDLLIKYKTEHEKNLLSQINYSVNKINKYDVLKDFLKAEQYLKGVLVRRGEVDTPDRLAWEKYLIKSILQDAFLPEHGEIQMINNLSRFDNDFVFELIMDLFLSSKGRLRKIEKDKLKIVVQKLSIIVNSNNSHTLEEFLSHLRKKEKIEPTEIKLKTEDSVDLLRDTISLIKNQLNEFGIELSSISKYLNFNNLNKLEAVLELLLFDLLAILDLNDSLPNNLDIIDESIFILRGKCLRNHLAHENVLFDYLNDSNLFSVLLANALKYCIEPIDSFIPKNKSDNITQISNIADTDKELIVIRLVIQFFVCLEHGDFEAVKNGIRGGIDILTRYLTYTTLHYAAKSNDISVLKYLLDAGLGKESKCNSNRSPLHLAAEFGCTKSIKLLLESGMDVNEVDHLSRTPLHIAAMKGHKGVASVLIKNNANLRLKDSRGNTPLHCAAMNNHTQVMLALLVKENHVDDNVTLRNYTALHKASEHGLSDIVKVLIEKEADVNRRSDPGQTPLLGAAIKGHYQVVKILLDCDADVNCRTLSGITPLRNAAAMGHEKIVKLLLEHGAKVNISDLETNTSPLDCAAYAGHVSVVELLLQHKADACNISQSMVVNNEFFGEGELKLNTLCLAVKGKQYQVVKILINHGIQVKTDSEVFPLHVSVLAGSAKISKLLLEKNKSLVNDKCRLNGMTPLHLACRIGDVKSVQLLLDNGASIYEPDNCGRTALHSGAYHVDVLKLIIKNKININALDKNGLSPLSHALQAESAKSVSLLLENGADANVCKNVSPLLIACINHCPDITQLLINNGAKVDLVNIIYAVNSGQHKIFKIFLDTNLSLIEENFNSLVHNAVITYRKEIIVLLLKFFKTDDYLETWNNALLLSCYFGYKGLVRLLVRHRVNVNCILSSKLFLNAKDTMQDILKDKDISCLQTLRPIHLACYGSHTVIVKILLQNGASINAKNSEGETPLFIASYSDDSGDLVSILLEMGADINITDVKNRTPFEIAVSHARLGPIKELIKCLDLNVNSKGNDGWTPLHIAAQGGNIEVTRILVNNKANIRSRDDDGSMPIHIAASYGHLNLVQFFLQLGLDIMVQGAFKQTLLHYASTFGRINVIKYLIEQNALVNQQDIKKRSCLSLAIAHGHLEGAKCLIRGGSFFNALDVKHAALMSIGKYPNMIELIAANERLFKAVKENDDSGVIKSIKAGAIVDAKDVNSSTPLHFAAWKGHINIVNILLREHCNVNITGKAGLTPLHYAVQSSHYNVVVALLLHGAFYDVLTDRGKTPLSFSNDKLISELLSLIDDAFNNVRHGDCKVLRTLSSMKNNDVRRVYFSARDSHDNTLVATAVLHDFEKINSLKSMYQDGIPQKLDLAQHLFCIEKYDDALREYNDVLNVRRELFPLDDPSILEIEFFIASALYKKQEYNNALDLLNSVYLKYKRRLGENHKYTLRCLSFVSLIYHSLNNNEKALVKCKEALKMQKKYLGLNHPDVNKTVTNYIAILISVGEYEKALVESTEKIRREEETNGFLDPVTLVSYQNLALTYSKLGQFEKSLQIYEKVYHGSVRVLGKQHSDTMRTMHNMIMVQFEMKTPTAMKSIYKILEEQKSVLGVDHEDVLVTQINIAKTLFLENNFVESLNILKECYANCWKKFGKEHHLIKDVDCLIKMNEIGYNELSNSNIGNIVKRIHDELVWAINAGDEEKTENLLKMSRDTGINDKDADGKTLLHIAVNNGNVKIIKFLLDNKANPTLETNKGNTCLHLAVSKPIAVTQFLLQTVRKPDLHKFINTKTKLNETSALHQAARLGRLDQVKVLLKHGAVYNIFDVYRKTPLDVCQSSEVRNILSLIDNLFVMMNSCSEPIMVEKIRSLDFDTIMCLANTKNRQDKTFIALALSNHKRILATFLLTLIK